MISGSLLVLALACCIYGMVQKRRAQQTLARMDKVLDQALAEERLQQDFQDTFDDRIIEKLQRFIDAKTLQGEASASNDQNIQRLIADIAHQTKTPITNISLFGELLLETEDQGLMKEYAGEINSQAQRLKDLIEELVKTSYLEQHLIKLQLAKHQVQPWLQETVSQFRPAAATKQMTLWIHDVPELSADFDERWLEEALGNLVDNAIKYGEPATEIRIEVVELASFLAFSVTNIGVMIPEAHQGKVFQRFYRGVAEASTEGLGIGLYLTREIIQLHGGFVKVDSSQQQTTFALYLPK